MIESNQYTNGGCHMKKVLKSLLVLVLLVVVALAGLLGWLTVTEYNPDPIETL